MHRALKTMKNVYTDIMLKVLNASAKEHGLTVRLVEHTTGSWYEVRRKRKPIYRTPRVEDLDAYFGRLIIAKRFGVL